MENLEKTLCKKKKKKDTNLIQECGYLCGKQEVAKQEQEQEVGCSLYHCISFEQNLKREW